jgi:hypothetical protein
LVIATVCPFVPFVFAFTPDVAFLLAAADPGRVGGRLPGVFAPDPGLVGAFPVVGEDAAVTFGVINRGWESRLMLSWRALLDGRNRAELLSTVVGLGVRVLGAVAGRLLVVDVLLLGFVAADVGL